eukprot:2167182-Prymnesium_polylepis.1
MCIRDSCGGGGVSDLLLVISPSSHAPGRSGCSLRRRCARPTRRPSCPRCEGVADAGCSGRLS